MGSFTGSSKELPDQPVRTVDPEVERLAHVVVDGLIARLALEPAVPASSLLDNLAGQLEQAAALHRLGLVRRTPSLTTEQLTDPRCNIDPGDPLTERAALRHEAWGGVLLPAM